jgi:hypothetical protein
LADLTKIQYTRDDEPTIFALKQDTANETYCVSTPQPFIPLTMFANGIRLCHKTAYRLGVGVGII